MKFSHEFQAALLGEGFPSHWVDSAFEYKKLKKFIKKVKAELGENGINVDRLVEGAFEYNFEGDRREFRPKLTLLYEQETGLRNTEPTRAVLSLFPPLAKSISQDVVESVEPHSVQRHEISLTRDIEFFNLLQTDVKNLDSIQEKEERNLINEISSLSTELMLLTKPSKYSKSDMYRWRELFDIYVRAGVFFSTNELDHGQRNSTEAKRQLEWFQTETQQSKIIERFKMPASREALNRFLKINVSLWQNLKYQEINQMAIAKILKKFDKRTKLGAAKTFPKLIQPNPIMSETLAKAVCSQVYRDIVKITPRLDDYICPVCFTIVWRPINMICGHMFCIGCTVSMQRARKRFCPLCRGDVILRADTDSIDKGLSDYLKKHFPKEVKEKQIEYEIAAGKEQFGIYYTHPSESRCLIM